MSVQFQVGLHLAVLAFVFLLGVIIFFTYRGLGWSNPNADEDPMLCSGRLVIYFVAGEFVILFVLVTFSVVKLWRVYDPYHIKTELKLGLLFCGIAFPLWVIGETGVYPPFQSTYVLYVLYFIILGLSYGFPVYLTFKMITIGKLEKQRRESSQSLEVFDRFQITLQDAREQASFEA